MFSLVTFLEDEIWKSRFFRGGEEGGFLICEETTKFFFIFFDSFILRRINERIFIRMKGREKKYDDIEFGYSVIVDRVEIVEFIFFAESRKF